MNTLRNESLAAAVVQVLERMAFLLAEPANATDVDAQARRHARVVFRGPGETGELLLSADDGFVCDVAAGLLGVDPSDVDAGSDGVEALVELANVIGGEVLRLLGAAEVEFQLGLPAAVEPTSAAAVSSGTPSDADLACVIAGENGRLRIDLRRRPA